jgi:hypothetical protein
MRALLQMMATPWIHLDLIMMNLWIGIPLNALYLLHLSLSLHQILYHNLLFKRYIIHVLLWTLGRVQIFFREWRMINIVHFGNRISSIHLLLPWSGSWHHGFHKAYYRKRPLISFCD